MKIYVPKYYFDFSCINKECKHSCCEKWEIDIDKNTYEYYNQIPGGFGDRIRNNLQKNGQTNCFRLIDGRCPFLDKDGLCDIISTLGEESLCQICTDHPRFRNYFSNKVEMGLGLSCEEAARIILSSNKNSYVYFDKNEEEKRPLSKEEKLIGIYRKGLIKNISKTKSIKEIFNKFKLTISKNIELFELLNNLEILDGNWTNRIKILNNQDEINIDNFNEIDIDIVKRLSIYFINRYIPKMESLFDDRFLNFISFSLLVILSIISKETNKFENIVDVCREYSEEIEYSEDNVNKVISLIK